MSENLNEEQLRRKANQHWDMAGLARQDRDYVDAEEHTKKAREYERRLKDMLRGSGGA